MRTLLFSLLLLPFTLAAQKTDTFLKLTDATGLQIKGDATTVGYERNIYVLSFNSGGKNNSQLTFTMSVNGASADLKKAMGNGSLLQNGVLTVARILSDGKPAVSYTIKMEGIKVNSCSESMGCNNAITTNTVLTATRIGWTYYETDKTGRTAVSRKYGFDNETGKEWTNF